MNILQKVYDKILFSYLWFINRDKIKKTKRKDPYIYK